MAQEPVKEISLWRGIVFILMLLGAIWLIVMIWTSPRPPSKSQWDKDYEQSKHEIQERETRERREWDINR